MPEWQAVPMWLHEFQLHVTDSLGRLEIGQESIKERLDRINGSVGNHDKRLAEIDERNAAREYHCPLIVEVEKGNKSLHDQIAKLQQGVMADRTIIAATKKENDLWYNRIRVYAIPVGLLFLGMLLGTHGTQLVTFLKALTK